MPVPTVQTMAMDDFLRAIGAPPGLTLGQVSFDSSMVTIHLIVKTVEAPE